MKRRRLRNALFPLIALAALFLSAANYAQSGKMTVIGDSLVGETLNGEKIRTVIGNVKIFDKKATVTCDKSVQHLESGNIDLFGNVVFVQDTIKLYTERARYLSENKIGIIDTTLLMITERDSIRADYGKYFFDDEIARFYGNVNARTDGKLLLADTLVYYRSEQKIFARGNVAVQDSASQLFADTLLYFEKEKVTRAYGNVLLQNNENGARSVAGFFLDSSKTKRSYLARKPLVMQIDSANDALDTLLVSAENFAFSRDSANIMFARDSVKIIRGNFSLIADSALFDKSENYFVAVRKSDENTPVVLWFEKTQIYGDTISVFLSNNAIETAVISGNVSLIENVDSSRFRYNQISGEQIKLRFRDNELVRMDVSGKTLDIYYLNDEGESQGLIKSSSNSATIVFDSAGVAKVKLFGNPNSEFHPEKLIAGKERDFLLPSFRIFKNKPDKKAFLRKLEEAEKKIRK